MRGWIVLMVLAMGILAGGEALAGKTDGFSGTAFGTPLTSLPAFMILKSDGDATYAVNLQEGYRIGGKSPVVVYGFAGGRLFAAYVRLDGLTSRDAMAKELSARHGKPSVSTEGGVETLRWRAGKTKIKLKSNPAAGSLKLGYYSTEQAGPAARLLEADSLDIDALARLYDKDKMTKAVSLPGKPAPKGYSPYDDGVSQSPGRAPGQ